MQRTILPSAPPSSPRRRGTMLLALFIALAWAAPAAAQETMSGVFHLLWHDPHDRQVPAEVTYHLTDDQGHTYTLDLRPEQLRAHGGALALNRRRVRVTATRLLVAPGERDEARLRVVSLQPEPGGAALVDAVQSGSRPYATLLCRFADMPNVAQPVEWYQALLAGTAPRGLDDYWREVSEGRIDLGGSVVVGWLDLPHPHATYFPKAGSPDFWRLVADCTAKADSLVDFRRFAGINLQLSLGLFSSWGGSAYVTADSLNRVMPVTWMSGYAGHATYAHEMGHSFGLHHSSGPYGNTYDSRWDVMSYGYDSIAQHTISYHKDLLGWIPAAQRYVPAPGSRQTLVLNRSELPGTTQNYQMAQIPIADGEFYTVEVRRWVGYDRMLPDEGVLIHRVNPARSDRVAQVVDADGNYNTNDGGALWLPGERFVDTAASVMVAVDSALTATGGFRVTISRSAPVVVLSDSVRRLGVVLGTYADTLRADGGVGVYSWSVVEGALPPGLALDAASGVLSGAPAQAGSWWFIARAASGGNNGRARFRVDVVEPLRITSDSVRAAARLGAPYADTLRAAGGTGAYAWSVEGGSLPAGLALDGATGIVSGTAAQAGTHRVTVRATSATLAASLQLVVRVAGPLALLADSVRRPGTMGAAYRDTLRAEGGVAAPVWRVLDGQLPAGVALDSLTGVLAGVPAQAGEFRVTVGARSGDESAQGVARIRVVKPQLQAGAVVDQLLAGTGLSAEQAHFLDLLGNRNGRVDVGDVRAWLAENQQLDLSGHPVLQQIMAEPGPGAAQPRSPQR